jgi:hypothetical protein
MDRSALPVNRARLDRLRAIHRYLDAVFRVPGTNIRFGWDPIIGLVPWLGDAVTALIAVWIVVGAYRLGVPRIVQLRMVINIGLDVLIGLVPFLGDVADVFWQANTKNMALLEHHVGERRSTSGDWLFVLAVGAMLAFVIAGPILLILWLLRSF